MAAGTTNYLSENKKNRKVSPAFLLRTVATSLATNTLRAMIAKFVKTLWT